MQATVGISNASDLRGPVNAAGLITFLTTTVLLNSNAAALPSYSGLERRSVSGARWELGARPIAPLSAPGHIASSRTCLRAAEATRGFRPARYTAASGPSPVAVPSSAAGVLAQTAGLSRAKRHRSCGDEMRRAWMGN